MCSRELEDAVRDLEDGGVVGLRMEAGTVAGRKEAVAPKPMHGDAPEGPSVGGGEGVLGGGVGKYGQGDAHELSASRIASL